MNVNVHNEVGKKVLCSLSGGPEEVWRKVKQQISGHPSERSVVKHKHLKKIYCEHCEYNS